MNRLDGKTILVAGAAGLLGSRVVKSVLDVGAKVIAADLSLEAMHEKLNNEDIVSDNILLEQLDITNEQSVSNLFAKHRGISGAVNCTYPRNSAYGTHFLDVKMTDFNENLALHLGSSFLFTQQCAKYFKLHQSAFSLVNISSIYGVIAPKFEVYESTAMTMPVEYAAIKSALLHLSRYAVKYIKDSRFRINSVSPGGIFDSQPDAFLAEYKKHTNGEGMLSVNDILGAIIFLLSDDSKFATGQNIIVDDGFSL